MQKKYHVQRLITNDLYLAAFLSCTGADLDHLYTNGRKRVTFVLTGINIQALRTAYNNGKVEVNIRSFRDTLQTIRLKMDTLRKERDTCPQTSRRSLLKNQTVYTTPASI